MVSLRDLCDGIQLKFPAKKQYVLLKAEPSLQLQIQVLNQKVYFVKHLEVDSFYQYKSIQIIIRIFSMKKINSMIHY